MFDVWGIHFNCLVAIYSDRSEAEAKAKELAELNPNERFEVRNERGAIVWSPEWAAPL
jgi:hypothetical protein